MQAIECEQVVHDQLKHVGVGIAAYEPSMRPFARGQMYHKWTLNSTDVPNVMNVAERSHDAQFQDRSLYM